VIESIGVIGGGAWGTALALTAVRAGRQVKIWARDRATVAAIDERRENPRYLPGIRLDHVPATDSIAIALRADVIILAVPAQAMRAAADHASPYVPAGTPVVVAAKGLERGTDKRLTEVIAEVMPQAVPVVLSGPGFAADVGKGLPTAVTIAAADEALALSICQALAGPGFRPYAETDVVGVEIGGGVKNVLAIAAGVVAGRQLGLSAQAALTARAFAELRRLAEAMGARPETLMGLSGLGDLVLTCAGPQSRNFAYGLALGRGADPATPHPLAEGIATAPVALALARRHRVEAPIIAAVAAILAGELSIDAAIEGLMTRPLKRETG
jgi:glycerol-3-phosphate dehydrogenase (NAD(P)+)